MSAGRVSLLVEGGGMRGFYSGGVLKRLLDEGIRFDYVIGISSGALCATAYVGGRLDLDFSTMAPSALSFVHPAGFIRPRQGILNTSSFIDFLVKDALEPALASPARLLIPATDALTGELTWWDQRDCATTDDLYRRTRGLRLDPLRHAAGLDRRARVRRRRHPRLGAGGQGRDRRHLPPRPHPLA